MTDSTMIALVILRLNRWAVYLRWLGGSGVSDPRPRPVISNYALVMRDRVQNSYRVDTSCPVNVAEAQRTSAVICSLEDHLRLTIIEDYIVGGTQKQKALALGIEPRTFRHRQHTLYAILPPLFERADLGLPLGDPPPRLGRPPAKVK
jgi:hypothetical protein